MDGLIENPIKMDDLGIPPFLETPISWIAVLDCFLVLQCFTLQGTREHIIISGESRKIIDSKVPAKQQG